jgi:cAMP-dependent protein kinase regulator
MFSALNPAELDIVLNAMSQVTRKAGEIIITQGEDGDNLYVVESGVLSCSKLFVSYNLANPCNRKATLNPPS